MQKPLKKIYLFIFLSALAVSAMVTLIIYFNSTPYQLIKSGEKRSPKRATDLVFYEDLDQDGNSEFIKIGNKLNTQEYFVKIYLTNPRQLTDQYNFANPIIIDDIACQDFNNDGSKDVFIFSNNDHSLYLSVIDFKNQCFLIREQFIMSASPKNPYFKWDIQRIHQLFLNVDDDEYDELVFTIDSGYAKWPRGIFIYDFQEQKITRQFSYNAGSPSLCAVDLSGNHKKEIVIGTYATANFDSLTTLSDYYSWLMVFDQNLKFKLPPIKGRGKFSSFMCQSFSTGLKNYILAVLRHSPEPMQLFLMDSSLTFKYKKNLSEVDMGLTITKKKGKAYIVVSTWPDNRIRFLNDKLQTVNTFNTGTNLFLGFIDNFDLFRNGRTEFLCTTREKFYIKDEHFRTLAAYPFSPNDPQPRVSYSYKAGKVLPDFSLNFTNHSYLLTLKPNQIFNYLPLTFLGLFLTLVILFFLLHTVINKLQQYISYFLFSLKSSDNAILLLNHNGQILSVNHKVADMLRLDKAPQHGQHFTQALRQRRELIGAIEDSVKSAKQIKNEIAFEEAQSSFIGQITVTPFFSYFKFINAYLIEIKDSTRQVLSERQQNWQRNVRKMVHDIKNPLAGVQLKLQTLYLKLIEAQPNLSEDLKGEFEMAYSELKRIRNISKDFLQFSDLDKLNIKELSLQRLCEDSVEHFKAFRNEYFSFITSYASDLPQKVRWDERQIGLLLHILIENAIDAMNGKGKIAITVSSSSKKLDTPQPFVEIRIADSGTGIPEKDKDKIFEPHFSTKTEGSGMGLTFAKQIVHQHGGTIDFYSDAISGTVFVITLPVTVPDNPN